MTLQLIKQLNRKKQPVISLIVWMKAEGDPFRSKGKIYF